MNASQTHPRPRERPSADSVAGPWMWRPDHSGFFADVARRAAAWTPDEQLALPVTALRERLIEAAVAADAWIVHPFLSAITSDIPGDKVQRDVNVAVWAAAHTRDGLGTVQLPRSMALWSSEGNIGLDAGGHDLDELGAACAATRQPPSQVSVDVWCLTVGHVVPGGWTKEGASTPAAQRELFGDARQLIRTIAAADQVLSDISVWWGHVTKVLIPLHRLDGNTFRSGSEQDVPGMVYLDATNSELQILEAVVHESAHLHLFMALACEPMVEPEHNGRYVSPLRPDPRPLRGIILAYHALAYIAALFADITRLPGRASAVLEREWTDTCEKMNGAEATIVGAKRHLTSWGQDFVDHTQEVAAYGRHST
jgi:HEXXH motif-containing protein